jgi:PleD family two-component response regulator
MAEEKPKILIVEDDLDVAEMLNAYFGVQGYEVFTVNWGEDGVRACQTVHPDLVILDIRLPDIDGYEVARQLRGNRRTQDIPIIFLTEKREHTDKLQGLELGADDYITKPFDVQELRLRVRNTLRRATHETLTNPVSGLPEGPLVDEHLRDCLGQDNWGILVVSLENLDHFREAYGFVASDDVLRAVSLMIQNTLREVGSMDGFLGHLSLTDFVMVILPMHLPEVDSRIRSRLERSLDYFYPIEDRDRVDDLSHRLAVKMTVLTVEDGNFSNLEQLKSELIGRKQ